MEALQISLKRMQQIRKKQTRKDQLKSILKDIFISFLVSAFAWSVFLLNANDWGF